MPRFTLAIIQHKFTPDEKALAGNVTLGLCISLMCQLAAHASWYPIIYHLKK